MIPVFDPVIEEDDIQAVVSALEYFTKASGPKV